MKYAQNGLTSNFLHDANIEARILNEAAGDFDMAVIAYTLLHMKAIREFESTKEVPDIGARREYLAEKTKLGEAYSRMVKLTGYSSFFPKNLGSVSQDEIRKIYRARDYVTLLDIASCTLKK